MEHQVSKSSNDSAENKDMLYLMGGLALIALGAGLIMTHPAVRKAVSTGLSSVLPDLQDKFMPDLAGVAPDIERYMKIRTM